VAVAEVDNGASTATTNSPNSANDQDMSFLSMLNSLPPLLTTPTERMPPGKTRHQENVTSAAPRTTAPPTAMAAGAPLWDREGGLCPGAGTSAAFLQNGNNSSNNNIIITIN